MPIQTLEMFRGVFAGRRAVRSHSLAATLVVAAALLTVPSARAAEIFVSPSGLPGNNGTQAKPIDLKTALSENSPARPGDTIWLLDGTYVGTYRSYLTGTSAAPIIVRQYPGARATLDGAGSPEIVLEVFGAWAIYWGFELTNSNPARYSSQTGPWPGDLPRGHGIFSWGQNIKFVNLVLHDLQSGIGLWTESVNSEIYGSLVYHNGWQAPDRAHGHGIYTQNRTGHRQVRENIIFNQFSHGVHAYASDAAYIDNITLEGNVSFNNGIVGRDGFARDLLLGGGNVAQNPVVRDNSTYGGGQSNLGYTAGCANGQVTGNYFVGGAPLLLPDCAPVLSGNTFYDLNAAQWGWESLSPLVVPANAYFTQSPPANVIRVRRNAFEPGRGHVIVYNWTRQPSVSVDLRAIGLAADDEFEIRDAQDFFGLPVFSGVYSGAPVTIPMTGLSLAPPVGSVPKPPKHTSPEFAVFVVLRTGPGSERETPAERATAATPVINPAGGSFTQPVTVSLTTASAGATIRYTTDNSLPTAASPIYTKPFVMSVTGTVQARSFAPDLIDSPAAVATFTITAPSTVVAPTITPPGGTFTAPVSVSIATTTGGATIRYTTDGSVPEATSPIYSGPFVLGGNATVRARAFAPSMIDSRVTSAVFSVTTPQLVAAPTISPAGGTFTAPVSVSLASSTAGATIRYTIDGSNPASTSPIYSGPFVRGGNFTVRARAFRASMIDSPVTSAVFAVSTPQVVSTPQSVAAPTVSPAGGAFTAPVSVSLASGTAAATIRYTTNGSNPTSTSPIYSGPFVVGASATVKARAFAASMTDSPVTSAAFTVNTPQSVAPPALRDNQRPKVSAAAVRDVSRTAATVRWTTNEPADSELLFYWNCPGACTISVPALVTDHSVTVTGLRPDTDYTVQIWSRDAAGNEGWSSYLTIRTPR